MNNYTLLTYVENKPGVLGKIANLIRRKMYNIETLTVSDIGDARISGMTITIETDNIAKVEEMMKQIQKIPEVITIKNLDPEKSFWREVALVKCNLKQSKLEQLKSKYNIELLYSGKYIIIQLAGTKTTIDSCISEIGESNIIDVTRTGVTAIDIDGISEDYRYKELPSLTPTL